MAGTAPIPSRPANPLRDWFAGAFNTAILQKSRMAWIDYLRGIAIVLVVYRHVLLGLQNSGMAPPSGFLDANIMFFSFRMPLFFILSGIFITGSLAKKTLAGSFTPNSSCCYIPILSGLSSRSPSRSPQPIGQTPNAT